MVLLESTSDVADMHKITRDEEFLIEANDMGAALGAVDLGGHQAKAIAAGENHTCAILDNGSVVCWGENGYGQLGRGDDTTNWGTSPLQMGGGLVAGALIVLGAIMPAEFNTDPLGLGKLSGIARLWAPEQKEIDASSSGAPLARDYDAAPRTDVIEIPLTDFLGGAKGSELEYKVRMKKDASLIYEWEVIGAKNANDFHFDFHGHTTPEPGQEMTVATYKQARGVKQTGALTAPFDGIQGWQFSNSSEQPVVVRLRLAGFYELIPSGQPGNEAGIVANEPAARARPSIPATPSPQLAR